MDASVRFEPSPGVGVDASVRFEPSPGVGVEASVRFEPSPGVGVDASVRFEPSPGVGVDASVRLKPSPGVGVDASVRFEPSPGVGMDASAPLDPEAGDGASEVVDDPAAEVALAVLDGAVLGVVRTGTRNRVKHKSINYTVIANTLHVLLAAFKTVWMESNAYVSVRNEPTTKTTIRALNSSACWSLGIPQ